MWHAFRRLWATERKAFPVKGVAAAGGWKDIPRSSTATSSPMMTPSGLSWSREARAATFDDEAQGVRSRR